jgi:hypothetical protein
MNHIDKLKQFGFSLIGEFDGGDDLIDLKKNGILSSYINGKLNAMGEMARIENVIYAYVVDGMVVYLGESERTFGKRYNNHVRNLVDSAIGNKPAYLRWVEFFKATDRYEIWQMAAPQVEVMGLTINIRQDFETALIGIFSPPMNTRTKGNYKAL